MKTTHKKKHRSINLSETEQSSEFLDNDNISKLLLTMAVPSIIGGIGSALYNLVDSMFLGHYVGAQALAALSINSTFNIFFIACAALFSMGSSILISNAIGAKDYGKIASIISSATWTAFIVIVLVSSVILIFLDDILKAIGALPEVLPYARSYAQIVLGFAFLTPLNGLFAAVLRAKGKSRLYMYASLIATGLNVL